MRRDLDTLTADYKRAKWTPGEEPIIGSLDCPVLAEHYGDRGRSCYEVFIYERANGGYGCLHEMCFQDGSVRSPSSPSLAKALCHQRKHHF
jgi:hypothetical protein